MRHNKIDTYVDTPDSGSSVVSGLQFLNIEHWGKFAISLAAAVLTLGPGASTEREDQGGVTQLQTLIWKSAIAKVPSISAAVWWIELSTGLSGDFTMPG